MKYIKKFENETHKYKEGDYVLIDTHQVKTDVDDFQRAFGIFEYNPKNKYCYYVRGFDFDPSVDSNSTSQSSVSEDEVSRLLTTDEINEFNAKRLAMKFSV